MLWRKDSECSICTFPSCITHFSATRLWSFIYNNLYKRVSSSESPKSWEDGSRSLSSSSAKMSNLFWLNKWMACFGQGFLWNVLGMSGSSDHLREDSIGKGHKGPGWKEEMEKDQLNREGGRNLDFSIYFLNLFWGV